jgi:DMSO reductase family type II enzyme heme b subunit
VAVQRDAIPKSPDDATWRGVQEFPAELILQDMVEPRLLEASTSQVKVKVVTDGKDLAFRLEWADATKDDLPGTARFSDACAVQLPAKIEPDVPAPQMGEPNRAVEISYWRAFWQASVDGREDSVKALYPGAAVDHYPFEAASLEPGSQAQQEMAARYAPAHALGNEMGGPRSRPVEDLMAEGPGTIQPLGREQSEGRGIHTGEGWAVTISRPLPPGLRPGLRGQVALAVWEGSRDEVGARKMRSAWVPIVVEGERE